MGRPRSRNSTSATWRRGQYSSWPSECGATTHLEWASSEWCADAPEPEIATAPQADRAEATVAAERQDAGRGDLVGVACPAAIRTAAIDAFWTANVRALGAAR